MSDSDKLVLIMGAGTVGIRDADVLLSLGIPVALCKYDAHPDDIKTAELKRLFVRYRDQDVGKRMKLYAARGSRAEERAQNLEREVGSCAGVIDELDFDQVELVIDATDGMEMRNHNEIYMPHNLPFAINGGADVTLVKGLYFASVPNSRVSANWREYASANAKIVSCNTHCVTTALGILANVIKDPDEFKARLRDINVIFNRRHDDPHKGKNPPQFVTVKAQRYHIDEVDYIIPQAAGMIDTTVSKWPTEYFHNVVITLDFHEPLETKFVEELRYAFITYPRAIYTEKELSHQKTMNAAKWARINDGDLPFPVYMLHPTGRYKIQLFALTPQRGIVAASTADYVLMRTGRLPNAQRWEDVFMYTNARAKYRNESFVHIKNAIQDNLLKYDEKAAVFEGTPA